MALATATPLNPTPLNPTSRNPTSRNPTSRNPTSLTPTRLVTDPDGAITSARDADQTHTDFQLVPELAALIPGGCLRPGSTVGVTGSTGRTSLLLQLLAGPMAQGRWAGVIGMPELGAQSGVEHGVPLNHLALIPDPGNSWLDVTAALLDSVELVVLRPPLSASSNSRCRPSDARRLLARARQRHSILIVVDPTEWPDQPDLLFTAEAVRWYGVSDGYGALRAQTITVQASGRRLGGRPQRTNLLIGTSQGPSAHIQRAG
jgi:hypothetical protein